MAHQTFPIVSGQFNLTQQVPRWLSVITITCTSTSGGSVTVTGPNGQVVYQVTFDRPGTASLSTTNFPQLDSGLYTVATTGTLQGSITIGDQ